MLRWQVAAFFLSLMLTSHFMKKVTAMIRLGGTLCPAPATCKHSAGVLAAENHCPRRMAMWCGRKCTLMCCGEGSMTWLMAMHAAMRPNLAGLFVYQLHYNVTLLLNWKSPKWTTLHLLAEISQFTFPQSAVLVLSGSCVSLGLQPSALPACSNT